jgi:RNA polymerase sigma factor (sigma-70 family)
MTPVERSRLHAAMVRFADGDRAAFREVFDGLWPLCLAIATRALGHREDAEDTAQKALLKVFDRIVDLDRERDGVAWAVTLAAFEVLTARKQRARRREDFVEADVAHDAETAPDQLVRRELVDSIAATIGELSARDRDALAALLAGAKTAGETERKRRYRAIERLRAAWRKAHG